MTAAVRLADVRRRFGTVDALDGLSWEAPSGRVTAVLGPNGAGKTTAIECAVGLRRPDAGTVRVLDVDPATAGPDQRARVGVLLQSGGLPNGARPMRLLEHLSRFYAEPADVAAMAARLGVPDFAGTTVRRLSGGQKQRLAIARAILHNPRILVMDDALAAVDPETETQIREGLERIMAGRTVFLIASRISTARRADKIIVIENGKITQEGTHDELMSQQGYYRDVASCQFGTVGAGQGASHMDRMTRRSTRGSGRVIVDE